MFTLPTTIELNGKEFPIRDRGDFRTVLNCFKLLNDTELDKQERALSCLIVFYDNMYDIDDLEQLGDLDIACKKMFDFFNCGQPDIHSLDKDYKLVDWEKDEQIIVSGINNVTKTEIRAMEYLHWWTFMGYYMAIGDSTLATVVSIRSKIAKNKKLEKYEKEFKHDNPQYFNWDLKQDNDAKVFEDELRKMWEQ